jgi:hypothetical protein
VAAARAESDLAPVQRLGVLLDHLGQRKLTGALTEWLVRRRPRLTRLRPDRPAGRARRDTRWRVLVNERLEPAGATT